MSTVFVLTQVYDYEGESVLGVYSSLEAAQAAAAAYAAEQTVDGLSVYEFPVDGAPVFLASSVWDY